MKALGHGCIVALLAFMSSSVALAQESKSAPLAKQLAAALDAAKLDSIAAKDPSNPDVYIGALYMAGFELLAVSAKYSAPTLLDSRLTSADYREVYLDLSSAAVPGTKVFVEDLGIDGVKARREDDQPFDTVEISGKRTIFDSEWGKQKISEADYMKAFAEADARYAEMLTALLAQLKKTS
jgi:hypothetical protein